MSRTWKWILGITLGLVILIGLGFVAANYFGFGPMAFWGRPADYGQPRMDGFGFGERGPLDGFREFHRPMMGRRGFGVLGFPFMFLGGIIRLLFPLAIVALITYFAYQQGKRAGINAIQAVPTPEPKEEISE